MGARGPKAKLTTIRKLEGNAGRLKINENEPKASGVPVCPKHLSAAAKAIYNRVLSSMPEKLYAIADEQLIAAYAIAVEAHTIAIKDIYKHGQVIYKYDGRRKTKDKVISSIRNPSCLVRDKQAELIIKIGDKLGLSPTSRQGINMPPETDNDDDLIWSANSSNDTVSRQPGNTRGKRLN